MERREPRKLHFHDIVGSVGPAGNAGADAAIDSFRPPLHRHAQLATRCGSVQAESHDLLLDRSEASLQELRDRLTDRVRCQTKRAAHTRDPYRVRHKCFVAAKSRRFTPVHSSDRRHHCVALDSKGESLVLWFATWCGLPETLGL